jgi:hypothetical protein
MPERPTWVSLLPLLDLLLTIVGVALLVAGIWQWSKPAASIALGLCFVALGLVPFKRPRRGWPSRNG